MVCCNLGRKCRGNPCQQMWADPIITLVYGAMSKKWLLRVFLLYFNFLGYFASSNPPLPESSCRQFFPLHAWLPFRIQNGRFIQFFTGIEKSSWKVCHLVRLIIRILKMYDFLYVRCLVTELWPKCNDPCAFGVKNDLDWNMPSDISNCSYDSRDSRNARLYVISHS